MASSRLVDNITSPSPGAIAAQAFILIDHANHRSSPSNPPAYTLGCVKRFVSTKLIPDRTSARAVAARFLRNSPATASSCTTWCASSSSQVFNFPSCGNVSSPRCVSRVLSIGTAASDHRKSERVLGTHYNIRDERSRCEGAIRQYDFGTLECLRIRMSQCSADVAQAAELSASITP